MKILFVGTPDFAVVSLKAILDDGKNEVVGVITAPDKPKGRGMKIQESDVKKFALSNGINVFQPQKVRNNPEFIEEIKALEADICVVVVYRKNITKRVFRLISKRMY